MKNGAVKGIFIIDWTIIEIVLVQCRHAHGHATNNLRLTKRLHAIKGAKTPLTKTNSNLENTLAFKGFRK